MTLDKVSTPIITSRLKLGVFNSMSQKALMSSTLFAPIYLTNLDFEGPTAKCAKHTKKR